MSKQIHFWTKSKTDSLIYNGINKSTEGSNDKLTGSIEPEEFPMSEWKCTKSESADPEEFPMGEWAPNEHGNTEVDEFPMSEWRPNSSTITPSNLYSPSQAGDIKIDDIKGTTWELVTDIFAYSEQ